MKPDQSDLSEIALRMLSAERRRRSLLRLVCLVVSLVAAALLLAGSAMTLDWAFALRPAALRYVVSFLVLIAFLGVGRLIRRKLVIDSGWAGTARWLDEVNPALEERLRTAVELRQATGHSPELLAAVRDQIDRIEIRSGTRRILDSRAFIGAVLAFGCAVVCLLVLRAVTGSAFPVLGERLLRPWAESTLTNLPHESKSQLHRRGKDFEVSVPVSGRIPNRARLQQRGLEGTIEERWISIDKDSGRFASVIPGVDRDFAYRIIAGDDRTPWNEVKVIDKPRITDFELRVISPAYTRLPERFWDKLPRRFKAPEGSEVRLAFRVDQPLSETAIATKSGNREMLPHFLSPEDGLFTYQTTLTEGMDMEIQLTSELGKLTSRYELGMIALPDQKPKVALLKETDTFALKADEVLEIKFAAEDDYGVEHAEVVVELQKPDGGKEEFRYPVDLGVEKGKMKFEVSHQLDLAAFPIEEGTRVSYAVEVSDWRGTSSREAAGLRAAADMLREAARQVGELNEIQSALAKVEQKMALQQQTEKDKAAADSESVPVTGQGQDVEKRKLDLAEGAEKPSTRSKPANVVIDEFEKYLIAGDGQKKQQIAIQEVIDAILESAREGRRHIAEIRAARGEGELDEKSAPPRNDEFLKAFRMSSEPLLSKLNNGIERAGKLREVSAGTPYAFFGLQSKAMVETGFIPAVEAIREARNLAQADEVDGKLDAADERLRWVISLLEKADAQFGEMIKLEEIVELTHQFKKMHTITVEDMPGGGGACTISPYPTVRSELSDQDVQNTIAALKLKREVLKRLSELLQDNPELRARMLGSSGEAGTIYREELSRLRNQQNSLAGLASSLAGPEPELPRKDPVASPPLPKEFANIVRGRLLEFSDQTTSATGAARIWIPTKASIEQRKKMEDTLSRISNAADALAHVEPSDHAAMTKAFAGVRNAGADGMELLSDSGWQALDREYVDFRREDLLAMEASIAAHESLYQAWRENDGRLFCGQLQHELNSETREIVFGLMGELSGISGVSEKTDGFIEGLDELLVRKLADSQLQAVSALGSGEIMKAVPAQTTAATQLEEGVKLLDSAIVEFVKARNALESQPPAPGAEPRPDPTEDQIAEALRKLLESLEKEARAASGKNVRLGIGATQNLKIQQDWEKDAKKEPGEMEQQRREMERKRQEQLQQAGKAQRSAAQAQQQANGRARQIAGGMATKPAVPWRDKALLAFAGRNDWNQLPGELKESLTQDLESATPEEYREAIQRYFRAISEASKP